jgi:hypothetical protein
VRILPGKTENLKKYMKEIKASRWADFMRSRQNMGVHSAQFWLQSTPNGDIGVVSLDVDNPSKFYEILMRSNDPFDVWFREKIIIECQGLDPNGPVPNQNELLLDFVGQPTRSRVYEESRKK